VKDEKDFGDTKRSVETTEVLGELIFGKVRQTIIGVKIRGHPRSRSAELGPVGVLHKGPAPPT
jgi:hypothetical protein